MGVLTVIILPVLLIVVAAENELQVSEADQGAIITVPVDWTLTQYLYEGCRYHVEFERRDLSTEKCQEQTIEESSLSHIHDTIKALLEENKPENKEITSEMDPEQLYEVLQQQQDRIQEQENIITTLQERINSDMPQDPASLDLPPARRCPDNYTETFNGKCYRFSTVRETFNSAQEICGYDGGRLATIEESETNDFILQKIRDELALDSVWIGLNDRQEEGNYVWSDGMEASTGYTDWFPHQPDNYRGPGEDCVEISPSGWNDRNCAEKLRFVCERETIQTRSWGMTIHNCPNNYMKFNKKCYKLSTEHKNFREAQNICEKEEGHLATIPGKFTNGYILGKISFVGGGERHWIGLNDMENEGRFVWSDGSTQSYNEWKPGEPNNVLEPHGEDCVHIARRMGYKWNDMRCDVKAHFVCEKEEMVNLEDTVTQLEQALQEKDNTIQQLSQEGQYKEQELRNLTEVNQQLLQQLELKEEEIQEKSSIIDQCSSQVQEMEALQASLQTQLHELAETRQHLLEELREMAATHEGLLEELHHKAELINQQNQQLLELQPVVQQLEQKERELEDMLIELERAQAYLHTNEQLSQQLQQQEEDLLNKTEIIRELAWHLVELLHDTQAIDLQAERQWEEQTLDIGLQDQPRTTVQSTPQLIQGTCGGRYDTAPGTIQSPGYPGNYPDNADCSYIITAPPGHAINITFQHFDLEQGYDFLVLSEEGGHREEYTGFESEKQYVSITNEVQLHFTSDENTNEKGFSLSYIFSRTCGGRYETAPGTIQSPGYPGNYPDNADCSYIITAPPGHAINITFQHFDLEQGYDLLVLSEEGRGRREEYTGLEPVTQYVSITNEVQLHFTSDVSANEKGFSLSYIFSRTCGGRYDTAPGTIQSPGYPGNYPDNADCSYIITAPPGHAITITFQHFDLETGYDTLVLREEGRQQEYTGLEPVTQYVSITNEVQLHFTSDVDTNEEGFSLSYIFSTQAASATATTAATATNTTVTAVTATATCEGLNLDTSTITSPGYPNAYPNNANCIYTIKAPPGHTVRIIFEEFFLEDGYDHLEITDLPDGIRRRHTGSDIQQIQTSRTNEVQLHFTSDGSVGNRGFQLSYESYDSAVDTTATTATSTCGGLNETNHIITSPDYPAQYPDNAKCNYTIKAPPGHFIAITFEEFQLESDYDFLNISDFPSGTNQKSYTGDDNAGKVYTSKTNEVQLNFTSDHSQTNAGFKLSYRGYVPPACPEGFISHLQKCYWISDMEASYSEAEELCDGIGAKLAVIKDADTQEFITNSIKSSWQNPSAIDVGYMSMYWIGLHQEGGMEGNFIWSDGSPLLATGYSAWDIGQPDSNFGDEVCVHIWPDTFRFTWWSDINCTSEMNFICERENTGLEEVVSAAAPTPAVTSTCEDIVLSFIHDHVDYEYPTSVIMAMLERCEQLQSETMASAHRPTTPGRDPVQEETSTIPPTTTNTNICDGLVVLARQNVLSQAVISQMLEYCPQLQSEDVATTHRPTIPACPEGFISHQQKCYRISDMPVDYSGAEQLCDSLGGKLAIIKDAGTQEFLADYIRDNMEPHQQRTYYEADGYWIGLKDRDDNGNFVWSDGSPLLGYNNWNPGEPSNHFWSENCVHMYARFQLRWNDLACGTRIGCICETVNTAQVTTPRPTTVTTPTVETKCEDLVAYAAQTLQSPTVISSMLEDCLQLQSEEERTLICPEFYSLYNQACYKASTNSVTYQVAEEVCEDDMASLAMIKDHGTQRFLENITNRREYWIGLSDRNSEDFIWSDGSPLSGFSSWQPGDPNHYTQQGWLQLWNREEEDCVSMNPLWQDKSCNDEHPYICQKAADIQVRKKVKKPDLDTLLSIIQQQEDKLVTQQETMQELTLTINQTEQELDTAHHDLAVQNQLVQQLVANISTQREDFLDVIAGGQMEKEEIAAQCSNTIANLTSILELLSLPDTTTTQPKPTGSPTKETVQLACSPGYLKFGAKCYKLGKGQRIYNRAYSQCQGDGGELLTWKDGHGSLGELVDRLQTQNGAPLFNQIWVDSTKLRIHTGKTRSCWIHRIRVSEVVEEDCRVRKYFICRKELEAVQSQTTERIPTASMTKTPTTPKMPTTVQTTETPPKPQPTEKLPTTKGTEQLSCTGGFLLFEGMCYKPVDHALPNQEAKSFCQREEARLMEASDDPEWGHAMHRAIQQFPDISLPQDMWVAHVDNDGSSPYNPAGSYMTDDKVCWLRFIYKPHSEPWSCDSLHHFICEKDPVVSGSQTEPKQTTPGKPECPAHSSWTDCGSACPASCDMLGSDVICPEVCIPGCQCDDGYVRDGLMNCVPKEQCYNSGCNHNGNHYDEGATWADQVSPGHNCECLQSEALCLVIDCKPGYQHVIGPEGSWTCQQINLQCTSGYQLFRDVCYKVFDTTLDYQESEAVCREDGGMLAMPRDQAIDNFLIQLRSSINPDVRYWIGLTDRRMEGVWTWADGQQLGAYSSWAPGEPNSAGDEDCALYAAHPDSKDKWNDVACFYPYRFICQKPAMVAPVVAEKTTMKTPVQQPVSTPNCPTSYSEFMGRCYSLSTVLATEGRAEHICAEQGAQLVVHDQDPYWPEFLMAELNALNREATTFQYWTNEPDHLSQLDLIRHTLKFGSPANACWVRDLFQRTPVAVNCSAPHNFICEQDMNTAIEAGEQELTSIVGYPSPEVAPYDTMKEPGLDTGDPSLADLMESNDNTEDPALLEDPKQEADQDTGDSMMSLMDKIKYSIA
ncbi:uncharacterized protein LOC144915035 isoform X2 [Branchiostoma floridae x Branchiostoma belcheri]